MFKSCYKWHNYLALNNIILCTRIALENYNKGYKTHCHIYLHDTM